MADIPKLSETKRQLLELYLRGRAERSEAAQTSAIPKRGNGEWAPLSFCQEQVWVHAQMRPELPIYNELITIHRKGLLDIDVLKRTLAEIVRRHEMWRTTFEAVADKPRQVIHSAPPDVDLSIVDLRGQDRDQREKEAVRLAADEGRLSFDLGRLPLWRAKLLRMEDDKYQLVLTIHQIIMDGVSMYRTLVPEIAAIYGAFSHSQAADLPLPPVQYGDFAEWQRSRVHEEGLSRQISYWKGNLAGDLPVLNWPNDRPRPSVQTFRGAALAHSFSRNLVDALGTAAKSEGATVYMVLLASFATLLYRYTGQSDIILGTPATVRNHPDLDKVMGYFLNPIPLRLDLSGEPTFRQVLHRVRNVVLAALANVDVPFPQIVKELHAARDLSRNPFFTVMLSLQPRMAPADSGWDLTHPEASSGATKLDMYLNLIERPNGIDAPILYNPDLIERSTVVRMVEHWQTLLSAAVASPDTKIAELPVLANAERDQLIYGWNANAHSYPASCVHQLFELQAENSPQATAIEFGNEILSYAELNRRSNRLAHYLRRLGAGPEARIGICVTRSTEMVVSLLGILKAGAAYVPMDPAYPRERLALMQEDADCALVVTQKALAGALPRSGGRTVYLDSDAAAIAQESTENPHVLITPNHLAYVIYTSGSTGRPKGVQIEHRSVVNLLTSMQREPGLQPQDVLLAVTSISFDIAGLEIYLPLITGAKLIIAASEVTMDGARLSTLLTESKATVMQATPATWRLLVDAGWTGGMLKVLCGGETLPPDLARQLTARSSSVWNLYGPTETTIWSAVHRVQDEESAAPTQPIGRPISNTQFYVLDVAGQLAPTGVPGELYIGGDGLARGYFQRTEESNAKFVTHAFGGRLYRTGDLVRYRDNGVLEFLGRTDNQVKVRGFRIELGEIENVLASHPAASAAVAIVRGQTPETQSIVAYVVPRVGQPCAVGELLAFAKGKLPVYMIPSRVMILNEFPLTPNKKVDRRALPKPDAQLPAAQAPADVPVDPIELRVLRIWESVLRIRALAVDQNFFDAGGHSLLAAQLIQRVEQAFGVRLSMAAVFQAPTVRQMAGLLRRQSTSLPVAEIIPLRPRGSKDPFFCVCVDAGPMYLNLLEHFDQNRPFLGVELNPTLLNEISPPYQMEAIAAILAGAIRDVQPEGPYYLGGYCISGLLAYETARMLELQGQNVAAVAMFLTSNPAPRNDFSKFSQIKGLLRRITLNKLWNHINPAQSDQPDSVHGGSSSRLRVANFVRDLKLLLWQIGFGFRARLSGGKLRSVREVLFSAGKSYVPRPISAKVGLFLSQAGSVIEDPSWGWEELLPESRLKVCKTPGNDWEIFWEANAPYLASALEGYLHAADRSTESEGELRKRGARAVS